MFHNKDVCRPPSQPQLTQILFRILYHFYIHHGRNFFEISRYRMAEIDHKSIMIGICFWNIKGMEWTKIDHISTMVGESFEISKHGMAEIDHKSTMVGQFLKYKRYGMGWNRSYLLMVEEKFEISKYGMAEIDHKSTMVGHFLKYKRYGMGWNRSYLHHGWRKVWNIKAWNC